MGTLARKQKFLILFFSLFVCSVNSINPVDAYIEVDVSVSPNPVQPNSAVQITVSASGGAVMIVGYDVIKTSGYALDDYPEDTNYVCDEETENPVSQCSHTFTARFKDEGNYSLSGKAVDSNGNTISTMGSFYGTVDTVILTVGNSSEEPGEGDDPPSISSISPNPVESGSVLTVLGGDFCAYYSDLEDTANSVKFDQSATGGTTNTASPISGSDCNTLRVKVPTDLMVNSIAKISVINRMGQSSIFDLSLIPATENNDNNDGKNGPDSYMDGDDNGLELNWPTSPGGTKLDGSSQLPDLIKYLYEWGIGLGGLGVFVSLLIAGIQYLTSFGNPTSMKDAISRIQSAIIGLVLLLSSWLILNTINPDLTNFNVSFNLPAPNIQNLEEANLKITTVNCDYVEVHHSGTIERIFLDNPSRAGLTFDINSIDYSYGFLNSDPNKPNKECMGQLKFYKKYCSDEIATLGPTNENITVDDDQAIKCIKFLKIANPLGH
jgi:hypothetical protein